MSLFPRLPFMAAADPAAELQRRVETLEETVADLEARLSALEEGAPPADDGGGEDETGAQARARISSILALPEAKAHPELAHTLALNGLSVELAQQALAAAGPGAPRARGALAAAMERMGSPTLGPGPERGSGQPQQRSERISRMADAYLGKGE